MNLRLPPFVFLFEPNPDTEAFDRFVFELVKASAHTVFNITDPIRDAASGLGLPYQEVEEQLRLKWPALLGQTVIAEIINLDYKGTDIIFTHCRCIEDLRPFLISCASSEILVINCGPIWALPPRCRVITIPVEGAEERLRFLQHELINHERAIETAVVQTTAQSAGPQDG